MRSLEAKQLFNKIANQIEQQPKHYNQWSWKDERNCGITHCIGGWAVVLSGAKFVTESGYYCELDIEVVKETAVYAQALLNLTDHEAATLFCSDWKPKGGVTVPEALRQIADGAHPNDVFCKEKELVPV